MNKEQATERLLQSFSSISQDWVKIISEAKGEEFYGIMWNTMWVVNDSVDKSRIEKMLKPVTDEDDEMYGAQEVGNTGIYAFNIDDELVLGINGAGYSFYKAHWIPLYEALGYTWHDSK